ncbi:NAD-binding protein [Schizopora paradoxa]|uniref:NAD-binding protein n=1 Tax=Schizopora paradoxa TaxID=27342 RepID=A0A0H2RYZ9_9AGAM|nr:NAD-binding protein [Schizopora paradoxa]
MSSNFLSSNGATSDNALGIAPETRTHVYPAIDSSNFVGALQEKVAFVTGAGRGIGKSIALALAQSGAHVALLSRTKSELEEVAEIIKTKFNRKALVFPVDTTKESAVENAFSTTERELGKVTIVVANAGYGLWRPFVYMDFSGEWWKEMELNVKAPMFLAQLAIKSMRANNEGTFIAISSSAACISSAGVSAYHTSKTALTRAIACVQMELDAEGKSGVHLYALHPGLVQTSLAAGGNNLHEDLEKMTPGTVKNITAWVNTFVNPPELAAQTCVYLASGKAKDLRGRYIDAEKDIEAVVEQAEIVRKENLYDLSIRTLGQ